MITKDFENDFNLECDVCGFECEEVFESFTEVVEWKKDKENQWGSRKIDGEWHDLCPDCITFKRGKR